ncbi:MAG: reverse transcriptase/maturase family protein [Oscillospiraceae bacterium]|nr:reverse transcriptase/maturase family protein [Oscillospiraceae bacterium]
MSLLNQLSDEKVWHAFLEYKTSLICTEQFRNELKNFIDEKRYLPVVQMILQGESFPLPRKAIISKMSSEKKRIVYTYPSDANIVLKLLTYLLLRKYNALFSRNLYSFRPGRTAKDAIRTLTKFSRKKAYYAYKADISNYFNSVPVPLLLNELAEIIQGDAPLLQFLSRLLLEECVLENKCIIKETKGIMAGTPLASFYANVFLRKLDMYFSDIPYARYSDDIILFADSLSECQQYAGFIQQYLKKRGLTVNPEKEFYFEPEKGWHFLGFSYCSGIIDIAPASVQKIKQKMRRKTRALMRWRQRNQVEGTKAAAAFIRIFNRKLLEHTDEHSLSWKLWFFSVINTADSLHIIDQYAQDCIRYLISGTHRKSRYQVRYADLKALGYRSLVHEYYTARRDHDNTA